MQRGDLTSRHHAARGWGTVSLSHLSFSFTKGHCVLSLVFWDSVYFSWRVSDRYSTESLPYTRKPSAELSAHEPFISPGRGPGREGVSSACATTCQAHSVSMGTTGVGKAEEGGGRYCGLTDGLRQQQTQGKVAVARSCSCPARRGRSVSDQRNSRPTASLALAGVLPEPGSCSQQQRCADFSSPRLSPGIASPRGTKEIDSFPH